MSDLRKQIEDSASKLKDALAMVAQAPTDTALPTECYKRWETSARLHVNLSGTLPLFDILDGAWGVVRSLVDLERIRQEEEEERVRRGASDADAPVPNFTHDGVPMDFSQARHLALTSLVTVTWSIYDRLANVCGRLAATDDVSGNPRKNPKLCEDLLARKKEKGEQPQQSDLYGPQLFAFSLQRHLVDAYAWPSKVAYTLRNWLVHEGYEIGSTPLFHSDRIEHGMRLHVEAVSRLERMCGIAWDEEAAPNPIRCCLKGEDSPWRRGRDKDLLVVLKRYHAEVDTMFAGLVGWSVDSFVGQIAAFAARDRSGLTAAIT